MDSFQDKVDLLKTKDIFKDFQDNALQFVEYRDQFIDEHLQMKNEIKELKINIKQLQDDNLELRGAFITLLNAIHQGQELDKRFIKK